MDPGSHQLDRVSERRLCIRMQGDLSRAQVQPLRRQLDATLGSPPRPAEIVFDLEQVTRCDIAACRTLALIQRSIAALGIRTAYVTDRPRVHGAAWWIVHASEDPHAMPVIDMKQAERWLAATAERLDQLVERSTQAIEQVTRALEGEP